MPYISSNWSVTDGVSLSVIKSKLVYSSLIFVDNKLTLLLSINIATISNSFCPLYTCYFTYLVSSASLRTNVKGDWGVWHNQPFCLQLCQMFTNFKIFFTSKYNDICNEVAHHSLNACYTTLSYIINLNSYFRLLPVFWHSYFTR